MHEPALRVLPLVALLAVSSAPAPVRAQGQTFEAVSVKPAKPPFLATGSRTGLRYYEPGTTLWRVIEFAYDLPRARVVGGPDWIDSDLWAIERSPAPATADEMRLMIRALLADRFGLRAPFESREMPVDEIYLARPDGTLGPNLTSPGSCTRIGSRSMESLRALGEIACGPFGPTALGADGTTGFRLRGVTMSEFASHLARLTGRAIRDRTGLAGEFDVRLRYLDGRTPLSPPRALELAFPAPLSDALKEQLGLRLETKVASVDVLLIESVIRPMAD